MTDAGFFRGTSTEQDVRFSDKDKKLLKTMKFEDCLEQKVDMHKVNFEALKPWVSEQVTKILGIEDEVVIELIFSFLENDRHPNAKKLQILVTGFLQSKPARIFIGQLWDLLLSAQENPAKLPEKFIEEKKNAIRQQKKRIEMQLNMRDDRRRFSPPGREDPYRTSQPRVPDPPRSPLGRGARERHSRAELGEAGLGVHVQKSEASSTQMEAEPRNPPGAALTKLKTQESEHPEARIDTGRDSEGRGGEQREKIRSRSRSYSPGRRQRSRSYERRYRPRASPHRYHYSPESHLQQRTRGHPRESPRRSRPYRSPEERRYHERHSGAHKQTEHNETAPPSLQRQFREYPERPHPAARQIEMHSSALKPPPRTEVSPDTRRHQHPRTEEKYSKRRPPPDRAISPKQPRHTNSTKQREDSYSSSRSPSPVKSGRESAKNREQERKGEFSASSSVSSESESSPSPEKRKHSRNRPKPKGKLSREPLRTSKREIARESTKRGRYSKHKHQRSMRSLSLSERSEHTSDNFSEIEARRKSVARAKKLKVSKKRHREKHSSGLRGKVERVSKRVNTERGVASKRKRRVRSLELSEDSEHTEEGKGRVKRKHKHVSPVVKKARHRRTSPPDSNSDSSESEESSSSDSNSDWSGGKKEKKRDKAAGRDRKKARVESSEISSETEDSVNGEKGRSSLEKHLREKVIQAMSKKKLKKNKN